MKTCRWDRIFKNKVVLETLLRIINTRILLNMFLQRKIMEVLFQIIITLWPVTIMITVKITRLILEAQILEIIN